jgi:hypothetical protein
MSIDRSFINLNKASTDRMRALAAQLTDAQLQMPVGEHWTPGIAFAHLAFWDWRVLDLLDRTERAGKLSAPEIDVVTNDLSLPLWAAIPPRTAAQLAVEAAEALDARLETFPPHLLQEVYGRYGRWVVRALHRNEHLDEVEAAVQGR